MDHSHAELRGTRTAPAGIKKTFHTLRHRPEPHPSACSRWAAAELLFVTTILPPFTLASTSVSCVFVALWTLTDCVFPRLKAGGTKQPYTRRVPLWFYIFQSWFLNIKIKWKISNPWCYFYCCPPPSIRPSCNPACNNLAHSHFLL